MTRRALRGPGRAAGQQHHGRRLRRRRRDLACVGRDQRPRSCRRAARRRSRPARARDAARIGRRPAPRTRRRGRAARRPRARHTSSSCGPAKSVFRYRIRAPSLPAANVMSMKPRWLRHRIPTVSPSRTPRALSAHASAFERPLSCANVSEPSSSISPRLGRRARIAGDLDRGADLAEAVDRAEDPHGPRGRLDREHPGAPGVASPTAPRPRARRASCAVELEQRSRPVIQGKCIRYRRP